MSKNIFGIEAKHHRCGSNLAREINCVRHGEKTIFCFPQLERLEVVLVYFFILNLGLTSKFVTHRFRRKRVNSAHH